MEEGLWFSFSRPFLLISYLFTLHFSMPKFSSRDYKNIVILFINLVVLYYQIFDRGIRAPLATLLSTLARGRLVIRHSRRCLDGVGSVTALHFGEYDRILPFRGSRNEESR